MRRGATAAWETTAPVGITINGIWVVRANSRNIGDGRGFRGAFFWGPGPSDRTAITDNYANVGCCRATFNSRRIGWFFACARKHCSNYAYLQVGELALSATENRGPTITPSSGANLFNQHGWVRGDWPLSFSTADPSGTCVIEAALGSQSLQGPVSTPNTDSWHQCPDQVLTREINTAASQGSAGLGEGSMPLTLWARNAAGVVTSRSVNVAVDNQPPAISLGGPNTASTTAGTQYINASAVAGPSGIAGISCSLDGGSQQWYPASSVRVPVQGFGIHKLTCVAYDNARDGAGKLGPSAPMTWTLAIQQPAVSTIAFGRLAGRATCSRVRRRIRIPPQWVTVVVRGRHVRVRIPAQTRVTRVRRCRPRVAVQRLLVNGHWVTRRVLLLGRRRHHSEQVPFGSGTSVSGWLGTADGIPLGRQRIQILTAPDNGQQAFSLAATAVTSADGTWTAHLQAGPSRLVEAQFGGNSAVEPATSSLGHLLVPAKVRMDISPHRTHWGGTIAIEGRLSGGYIPAAGELVVLKVGWHGGSTEIGHLYTNRDGVFRSTYTFLRGNGTERYRLWAATVRESDYPYAPARSPSVSVTVGP